MGRNVDFLRIFISPDFPLFIILFNVTNYSRTDFTIIGPKLTGKIMGLDGYLGYKVNIVM